MSDRKTLLKIGKLHIWTSGSYLKPYANIWMDCKGRKNPAGNEINYCGVNIFLSFKRSRVWTYKSCNHESGLKFYQGRCFVYDGKVFNVDEGQNKGLAFWSIRGGFNNGTPEWLQRLLGDYTSWKNWGFQFWGDNINEDGTLDETWIMPKRPSFIRYVYWCCKRRRKIKLCNHNNIEFEAHITGDSGSEDYFCPDCGLQETHCYY